MEVITQGILIGAKPLGENGVLMTLFSEESGKIRGLLKGARRKKADIQIGNVGSVTWTRRLEEQLGTFKWECTHSYAARSMQHFERLQVIQYMSELMYTLLPEGEAHQRLYHRTLLFLEDLAEEDLLERLAVWEVAVLEAVGYALSLSKETAVECENGGILTYVSPNTGRAVSDVMGEAYKERLLLLPHVFGGPEREQREDLRLAFKLTGFFLEQALHGKTVESRQQVLNRLAA